VAGMTQDEIVIEQLRIGAVSVDGDGRVWRHGKLSGDGTVKLFPESRRIDRKDKSGYHLVRLHHQRKKVNTSAHRMQWLKHHGLIPDHLEVNHKDTDKSNNRIDNLELMTRQENIRHAMDAKGGWWATHKGEKHPAAKLDWEKVRWVRANVGRARSRRRQRRTSSA
jgi:hypothetical protein